MSLLSIDLKPSARQLRQFSAAALPALPLIGWIWGALPDVLWKLAAVGLAIAVVGLVVPCLIRPLYIVACVVAIPIGFVVGELAMLLTYVLVFLPIGIVFHLLRRDALAIRRKTDSYWVQREAQKPPASYYRQY